MTSDDMGVLYSLFYGMATVALALGGLNRLSALLDRG